MGRTRHPTGIPGAGRARIAFRWALLAALVLGPAAAAPASAGPGPEPIDVVVEFDSPPGTVRFEVGGRLLAPGVLHCPDTNCVVTVDLPPLDMGCVATKLAVDLSVVASETIWRVAGNLRRCVLEPVAAVTPASVDFGTRPLGEEASERAVTITNVSMAPLDVTGIELSGGPRFSFGPHGCRRALAGGDSCSVPVRFHPPRQPGNAVGEVAVSTGHSAAPIRVALRGAAAAPPTRPRPRVAPTEVDLDRQPVGSRSAARPVTVTAEAGPVTLAGVGITGPGAAEFAVSPGQCQPGWRLEAGHSCSILVTFEPARAGLRSAALTVAFEEPAASAPPVPLLGVGLDAPALTPDESPARADPARLHLAPPQAIRGGVVAATGQGFRGRVRLWWSNPEGWPLAQVGADGTGRFEAAVEVPPDRPEGPLQAVACDSAGSCASASLTVLAGSTKEEPPIPLAGWVAIIAVAAAGVALGWHWGGGRDGVAAGHPAGVVPTREREVRTGFSGGRLATVVRSATRPLVAGRRYHFWVELGPPVAGPASQAVPLTVALYGYDGELDLASTLGEWELGVDGEARVRHQAALHRGAHGKDETLGRRLVFPIVAPVDRGRHRLRCSFYHEGTLVQSWVVTVLVRTRGPLGWVRALRARRRGEVASGRERDFAVSRTLDAGHLRQMAPHRLSLMLNDNDPEGHSFRVFGTEGFHGSAAIGTGELGALSGKLRRVLEDIVADHPPDGLPTYRYAHAPDLDRLRADLTRLARWGYRAYADLVHRLARGVPGGERRAADRLAELLREPGRIQVANRLEATAVVPAAFLYDHPLDTDLADLGLCPSFVAALGAGPLAETRCFLGRCPSYRQLDVVCPAGFWGFRHVIGMPQSLAEGDGGPTDMPLVAGTRADSIPVAVFRDPAFSELSAHLDRLRDLGPGLGWEVLDRRASILQRLGACQPPLVYLYCHGGRDGGVAYVQLGHPGEPLLTGDALLAYGVVWDVSHPLVFLNGCQTAAVGPETPLELVSAFVQHTQAVGVIGSEVTLFEPLACRFAEEFLRLLLVEGHDVGTAVRSARLSLLADCNPLGLVYVPFVADDVVVRLGQPDEPHPQMAGAALSSRR